MFITASVTVFHRQKAYYDLMTRIVVHLLLRGARIHSGRERHVGVSVVGFGGEHEGRALVAADDVVRNSVDRNGTEEA